MPNFKHAVFGFTVGYVVTFVTIGNKIATGRGATIDASIGGRQSLSVVNTGCFKIPLLGGLILGAIGLFAGDVVNLFDTSNYGQQYNMVQNNNPADYLREATHYMSMLVYKASEFGLIRPKTSMKLLNLSGDISDSVNAAYRNLL